MHGIQEGNCRKIRLFNCNQSSQNKLSFFSALYTCKWTVYLFAFSTSFCFIVLSFDIICVLLLNLCSWLLHVLTTQFYSAVALLIVDDDVDDDDAVVFVRELI